MFIRHVLIFRVSWKVPPAVRTQIQALLAISEGDFLLGHSSKCPLYMKSYAGASNNYWPLLGQFNILR